MSKILIIEDEAAIRRVLVKILSEENDAYAVDEAEDGLAGIEKIKKEDERSVCDLVGKYMNLNNNIDGKQHFLDVPNLIRSFRKKYIYPNQGFSTFFISYASIYS